MENKKYLILDLVNFINDNKSSDDIAKFYNVSGRTIRNWLKNEGLETKVRFKGYSNIILSDDKKIKNINRLASLNEKKLNNRITCVCETCKNEYKIKKSVFEIGSRFCSNKCKYIFMFKTLAENHPRWLGGKTQENQIGRGSLEYQEWRINVWKRDFFTCQKCFQLGKNLNAHHIDNWSDNTDLRYSIDNGITLCKSCHKELHKTYGQKTNNQHLCEFLDIKTANGWKRSNLESF